MAQPPHKVSPKVELPDADNNLPSIALPDAVNDQDAKVKDIPRLNLPDASEDASDTKPKSPKIPKSPKSPKSPKIPLLNVEGSPVRRLSKLSRRGSQLDSPKTPPKSPRDGERPLSPKQHEHNVFGVDHEKQIPLKFIIEKLTEQVEASKMYTDLVIFIPFLILYVFFFLGDRDTSASYFAVRAMQDLVIAGREWPTTEANIGNFKEQVAGEQPINIGVDKGYLDMGNGGDWGDWLKMGLILNTWDCKGLEGGDVSHVGRIASGQNIHLGALRVRTLRMRNDSCSLHHKVNREIVPDRHPNDTRPAWLCWDKHRQEHEQKEDWCGLKYEKQSHALGETTTAREGIYHPGGYIVEFPFNMTCSAALALHEHIMREDCPFVDSFATRFVTVEYFVYSVQFDTFHSIKIFCEVMPGGAWLPQYKFRSFRVRTARYFDMMVLDFFFLAYVLLYVIRYFYDLAMAIVNKQALTFLFEFWNFLEIGNLVVFGLVFGFRFRWWYVSEESQIKVPYRLAEYPKDLDEIMVLYMAQIYCNSINTILTFVKLLKFVRVNPRLSVLTKTMAEAQTAIIGVLILFGFVLVAYAIAFCSLYGTNIAEFRDLWVSIESLLRMLVGNFDYPGLYAQNRALTGFFFWSFIILALFLLLNFMIAILGESFGKVSGKAFSEPLEQSIMKFVQEVKLLLHKENFVAIWALMKSGSSQGAQVERMLDDLVAYHEKKLEELKNEQAHPGDELPAVNFSWKNMMGEPEDLYISADITEKLGRKYSENLWNTLCYNYDDMKKAEDDSETREFVDVVRDSVAANMAIEMKRIDRFDSALTGIEHNVEILLEIFGKEDGEYPPEMMLPEDAEDAEEDEDREEEA